MWITHTQLLAHLYIYELHQYHVCYFGKFPCTLFEYYVVYMRLVTTEAKTLITVSISHLEQQTSC